MISGSTWIYFPIRHFHEGLLKTKYGTDSGIQVWDGTWMRSVSFFTCLLNLQDPSDFNLQLGILKQNTQNQNIEKSINEYSGKNFSHFKDKLSEVVVDKISPISNEINKLLKDKDYIDKILQEGSKKAENYASKKVNNMKKIVGFWLIYTI